MVNRLQHALTGLSVQFDDPRWVNKPNAWIRKLAPAQIGKVGERLAAEVIGGTVTKNNRVGYDIEKGDMRIEVKLSTEMVMNGYPMFMWRQVRPSDPYTHLFLIAVSPESVRAFLIPKNEIPAEELKHHHGRGKSLGIFQIHARNLDKSLPWLGRYELT